RRPATERRARLDHRRWPEHAAQRLVDRHPAWVGGRAVRDRGGPPRRRHLRREAAREAAGIGSDKPRLSIEALRGGFDTPHGQVAGVRDAGLTIHAGEIVGLVGETGSGKTLVCRSVMRLIPYPGRITGGRVEFEGRDVLAMSARELREFRAHNVGMIYQDPFSSLNPVFRIGRQLTETLRVNLGLGKTEAWDRALKLLADVGISDPERRALSYP